MESKYDIIINSLKSINLVDNNGYTIFSISVILLNEEKVVEEFVSSLIGDKDLFQYIIYKDNFQYGFRIINYTKNKKFYFLISNKENNVINKINISNENSKIDIITDTSFEERIMSLTRINKNNDFLKLKDHDSITNKYNIKIYQIKNYYNKNFINYYWNNDIEIKTELFNKYPLKLKSNSNKIDISSICFFNKGYNSKLDHDVERDGIDLEAFVGETYYGGKKNIITIPVSYDILYDFYKSVDFILTTKN